MTLHTPLLLATVLATQTAPAQVAPEVFSKTSEADRARVGKAIGEALEAYENLRSYSGRFSNTVQPWGVAQTGTIQYEAPNLMAVRVKVSDRTGSYSRRIVCDGTSLWMTDSRFKNRYTKRPLAPGDLYYASATVNRPQDSLDMAWFLEGTPPLDASRLKVTSRRDSPTLAVDLYSPRFPQATEEKRKELHRVAKQAFRFDPTTHLLRGATFEIVITNSIHKRTERHWDIRLNLKLPAATFRFKPAPDARQVKYFDRAA